MTAWGVRLIALVALVALVLVCAFGARAAWLWQANVYGKQLAEQANNYGRQLAERGRLHGREREEAAAAALDQLAEQQSARRALEARLQDQTETHWKEMNDVQQAQARLRDRLATADLRLSVLVDAGTLAAQGCDGGCEKPPAPQAWYMEPYVPNLTQRMLNELSPSPTKATGD